MRVAARYEQGFVAICTGIALWSLPAATAVGAGIGGSAGGFGGGGIGFSGGVGFGVAPRVPSPVVGVPLPPVGYDGSNVGPTTNSRSTPRLDPQLPQGPEQTPLYKAATPGPRFDQGGGSPAAVSSSDRELGSILPPDGSGYLVVEDGSGGATIYGPTGVRRVRHFDRNRLHELTTP